MKKLISTVIMLILGGLIGIIIAMLIFGDLGLPAEYSSLPSAANLGILVLTYFIAVTVHELGHFIGFIKNGVKMRALFITSFLFIREIDGWKLRFRPNNVTFMGGIAVPNLDVINNDEELKKLQKAYSRAILDGPLATIVFWALSLASALPVMLFINNAYAKSVLSIYLISLTLITAFLLATCFFKSEIVIGDFPAYKISKTNPSFVAMQLYQYALFSMEPDKVRRENHYLKNLILEDLNEKYKVRDLNIFTLNIIDVFIVEYLSGVSNNLPVIVNEYINFIVSSPAARAKVKTSEVVTILWFHIIRLLFMHGAREKALDEYDFLSANINNKAPVNDYMIKQLEHVLGIHDYSVYLRDKDNIRISSAHGLWKNFEGYFIDEVELNRVSCQ